MPSKPRAKERRNEKLNCQLVPYFGLTLPIKLLLHLKGHAYGYDICDRDKSHYSSDGMKPAPFDENTLDAKIKGYAYNAYLRGLNPAEWKSQDHYKVLGLEEFRFFATDEDIRIAYRKIVLYHHPDKRNPDNDVEYATKNSESDYFTCISKAYEILGNPNNRKSYDSVDDTFDNSVPAPVSSAEMFFVTFGQAFKLNARWSIRSPVPTIGGIYDSRETVNEFYDFWYNFDSWREFSYLDEEEKEKGECREERRFIDKQNKAMRLVHKKEENARIRQLVDNAYNCDPRIQAFKEEDKQKKLQQKHIRQQAAKLRAEQELKERLEAEERERMEQERLAAEERALNLTRKKEQDALKKELKKLRKTIKTFLDEHNYFSNSDDPNSEERVKCMMSAEMFFQMADTDLLKSFLATIQTGDFVATKAAFQTHIEEISSKIEAEKQRHIELANSRSSATGDGASSKTGPVWTDEELECLVRAVKLFPTGTSNRWELIATFLNQHCSDSSRTPKETLQQAKQLQKKLDPGARPVDTGKIANRILAEDISKRSANLSEKQKPTENEISQRFDGPSDPTGTMNGNDDGATPWTADEQKLLEQALKTYPKSLRAERWEKISQCIPSRSKKEIMRRCEELARMVKQKKQAQLLVSQKLNDSKTNSSRPGQSTT